MKISRKVVARFTIGLALLMFFLALLIGPNLIAVRASARVAKTMADVADLSGAVEEFRQQKGRYPTNREGLRILAGHSKVGPTDAWGNPYHYKTFEIKGQSGFVVESYGADGKPGGEGEDADITDGTDRPQTEH